MSSGTPNSPDGRGEAIRDWARETEERQQLGRQFSGERLKGIAKGDWLTKVAFAAGTAVVLFFILTQESKEDRASRKKVSAAAQIEEPSVRDFRPPVMPVRTAMGTPQLVADSSKPVGKPTGSGQDDSEAAARRRKAEQIEEARTKSAIVVKGAGSTGPSQAAADAVVAPSLPLADVERLALGLRNQPATAGEEPKDPNRAFSRQMSGQAVTTAFPRRVGNLECIALQGKMIDAELETAINTDLPGQIRAIVSSPLYAEQGREPLVPAGSRLNGVYNSAVRKGQVRVFAIWNRLIRPDGVEITIDSGVTDALGRAGLAAETDNHFGQIFGMSVLLSIIGAGAGTSGVDSDSGYNSADAYRREVQQSFARTSERVLEPYASIPPTNSVAQGERIKVLLNRDLDFCPLKAAGRERMELVLP
jgi:type IV secretion system protein VirB10